MLAVLAVWPQASDLVHKAELKRIKAPETENFLLGLGLGGGAGLSYVVEYDPQWASLRNGWLEFDRTLWKILPGERPTLPDSPAVQSFAIPSSGDASPTPVIQKNSAPANAFDKTLFAMGFRGERAKQSVGWQRDLEVANLNSKVVLIDSDPDANLPVRRNGWQHEDTVKMPLNDRFFLVGQLGANSDDADRQAYKVVGRTGIGWKLPPWLGGEIQIRGGRSVTNYDSTIVDTVPERIRSFYEINTKWPVWRIFNLEYTQETHFAGAPDEHDTLNQDVRLAMPLSDTGQFHIGAKYYRYLDGAPTTPWLERLQFYLGLQYKR